MVVFYIFLVAFLAWAVISPLYPDKPAPTPEEVEIARQKIEVFTAQVTEQTSSLLEIALPIFLGLVLVLGVHLVVRGLRGISRR